MRYHQIERCSLTNGPGLRTVLWVSGCNHGCKGCHNRDTWNADGGLVFDQQAEDELFLYLSDRWVQGITFSGGDPLFEDNRETIGKIIETIVSSCTDKDIWLYTGYPWEEVLKLSIPWLYKVDVLVDGPFLLRQRDVALMWRGSGNQRVIDVKKSMEQDRVVLFCQ